MITLDYFKPSEFSGWFELVDPGVLVRLDVLRELWAAPISISQAAGAVGRRDESGSRHNVERWGAQYDAAGNQVYISLEKSLGLLGG